MSKRLKPAFIARGEEPRADQAGGVVVRAELPPTLVLNASGLYFEDSGLVAVAPQAQFSDPDSPNLGGGSLTVTINQIFATHRMALVTSGDIGLSGSNVTWQGITIGTLSGGGFGVTSIAIAFNANATPAAVQALIRAIGYENTDQDPIGLYLEFTYQVIDNTGGSVQAVRTGGVHGVDDRTVIANLDGDVAAATGGGGAVRLDQGPAVLVSDVDDDNYNGGVLSVRILQNYTAGEDLLGIANGNGVSVNAGFVTVNGVNIGSIHPASTDRLLFVSLNSNATPATMSQLINAVTYTNSNFLNPSTLTRGIEFELAGSGVSPANAGIAHMQVTVSAPSTPPPPPAPGGVPEGPRLLNVAAQAPMDTVLSGDGLRLFTTSPDGGPQGAVRIYNGETGALLQTIPVATGGPLDVSLDGRYLFVVGAQTVQIAQLHRVDLQTGEVTTFTYQLASNEVGFGDVACLDNGQVLLAMRSINSPNGHGRLFDPATGVFTDVGVIMPGPFERSADGHRVVNNYYDVSRGFLYDAELGVRFRETSDFVWRVETSAHSVNGLTATTFGGITILDSQMESLVRLEQYNPQFNTVNGLAFDETGENLFVLHMPSGQIVQLSTTDWSIVRGIALGVSSSSPTARDLQVAPDARYFTYIDQNGLVRVNNPYVSDPVQGTLGNDNLVGTAADDRLVGDTGIDSMSGGAGNDIYYVDRIEDVVVEVAGGGSDVVRAGASYALAADADVERLEAASRHGTQALDLTGNGLAQTLVGNAGANVLDGRGGADRMEGRGGNDLYYVDNAGDTIVEIAGGGTDIVYATVGFTLNAGAWVELLTATSIASTYAVDMTGNELSNTIWGNNGNNTLSGGIGGQDTLVGFLGNDIYIVNNITETIVENAGEGTDIVYVNSSYTLSAHASIELLTTFSIAGTQAYDLTGNNLDNTIWGNRGNNTLSGGFGGNDTLVGFLGNDIYIVNNITEVIVENAGEGTDIVYVNSSYTLSAHASIELLSTFSIAGTQNYDMTGNNLDNTIWGNRGNNTLSGGIGGNDTLVGFLGDDIYLINNGNEVLSELANEGTDIVYAGLSYVLTAGASVELLSTNSIGGTNALNLAGNELVNTIWGNGGANVLNGYAGSDTLSGFAGADTFQFNTALGVTNVDAITDFSVVDDTIALDDAIFAGIGTPGAFNANAFVTGAAAADADDRIVYNAATGELFFDADGNGVGAAVLFATLNGNPALTASDFQVI